AQGDLAPTLEARQLNQQRARLVGISIVAQIEATEVVQLTVVQQGKARVLTVADDRAAAMKGQVGANCLGVEFRRQPQRCVDIQQREAQRVTGRCQAFK
nr:hypothetical protein [Tanacetum cinerariifolium]